MPRPRLRSPSIPPGLTPRGASHSRVVMTEIVLPQNANAMGNAFGGSIMQWIDIAGGVAARRHAGGLSVTASMDDLHFLAPIRLGDIVVLEARVTYTGRSSIEVRVVVEAEDRTGRRFHAATSYLTYVALDEEGRPRRVPPLDLKTAEDRREFRAGALRKAARLRRKELALRT